MGYKGYVFGARTSATNHGKLLVCFSSPTCNSCIFPKTGTSSNFPTRTRGLMKTSSYVLSGTACFERQVEKVGLGQVWAPVLSRSHCSGIAVSRKISAFWKRNRWVKRMGHHIDFLTKIASYIRKVEKNTPAISLDLDLGGCLANVHWIFRYNWFTLVYANGSREMLPAGAACRWLLFLSYDLRKLE